MAVMDARRRTKDSQLLQPPLRKGGDTMVALIPVLLVILVLLVTFSIGFVLGVVGVYGVLKQDGRIIEKNETEELDSAEPKYGFAAKI